MQTWKYLGTTAFQMPVTTCLRVDEAASHAIMIYNHSAFAGVPRAPDYQCGRSQPAGQHPELVQEGAQAVSQSHAHCGALPLPG